MENTYNEQTENDEIEIDLLEIFYGLKSKALLILASSLLVGCITCAYTVFMVTPIFTSSASMLILTQNKEQETASDLQRDDQLTKDYNVLITSRPVLEEVIANLELNLTYDQLKSKISIVNPTDTRILEISVTDPNPNEAKKIVDELSQVSSEFIGEQMEMVTPKVIDDGNIPTTKTSPSTTKNAVLGLMIGFLLSAGAVTINILRDTSIKSEEDIEHYLGMHVLASVPYRKTQEEAQKSKKKKRKKKGTK